MSQGERNRPQPERSKADLECGPRDALQLLESLRLQLAQLRTMGDPKAAELAAECEAALVEMKKGLDTIDAMTSSRPALRF